MTKSPRMRPYRSLTAAAALVALATLLTSCASSKSYTADALPEEQLHFRWGGGFTGEFQSYLLLPNGQLFHKREVIEELPYREVEPIDKKTAKELFETYDKQGFGALGYDEPGNVTYIVTRVTGADSTQLTWGGTGVKPEQEVQTYWRRAMGLFEGKGD